MMNLLGITDLNTLYNKITEMKDEVERDLEMTTEEVWYHFYDGIIQGLGSVLALMEIPQD